MALPFSWKVSATPIHDPDLEDLLKRVGLRTIPAPRPGPGQALFRASHAAVNHSDAAFIKGFHGKPRVKGAAADFEGIGTVGADDAMPRLLSTFSQKDGKVLLSQ